MPVTNLNDDNWTAADTPAQDMPLICEKGIVALYIGGGVAAVDDAVILSFGGGDNPDRVVVPAGTPYQVRRIAGGAARIRTVPSA